ncbi:hypothetical protein MKX01_038429 [Papaver californicum]|nr:hypothetical protein MKX01_038429 [Papaver californicum]
MLGKTTRPIVIGKLLKPEFSGPRAMFSEEITSPKSPLDFKIRSPRGGMAAIGGVGLGILAALEKSGCGRSEIQMKFIAGNLNLNLNRGSTATATATATKTTNTNTDITATATSIPVPIPIGSTNATRNCREVLMDEQDSESYTYVTLHKPNNQSYTRVYCDHGDDHELVSKVVRNDNNDSKMRRINMSVLCESPPRRNKSEFEFPTSDFLSSCFLCRKKLHGKDIFMYRGEKAFCSSECRHTQIVSDERQEKCRSKASRYRDISISPCSGGGQLFSAGITAS